MSGSQNFHYQLFGLRVASEIELPELVGEPSPKRDDVWIRRARLPEPQGANDEVVVSGSQAGFFIEGVANYQVREGREILVDAAENAPMRNVRLYLLGSAMGLLLHQRGSLPLHANAVEIDGRAYAFMGPSGSGKSTLAMAFHDLGFRVIADDVCVVSSAADGSLVAHAGIPRLRIWEDALFATGRHSNDYAPSFAGDEDYRKFDVPMPAHVSRPAPLAAIYLLSHSDDVQLAPLAGADAVDALFANTYRGGFIRSAGNAQDHWRACIELVSRVPLFRLNRPLAQSSIGEITKLFEDGIGLIAT